MISSSRWRVFAFLLTLFLPVLGWAGLGETEHEIAGNSRELHARHTQARKRNYTVHELLQPDGSRIRQYVSENNQVFAVTWKAMHKPNMSQLLGPDYPRYAGAAEQSARRGGIQRDFRHEGADLVVHSTGHLHLFTGYAYRPSMFPLGFNPSRLGVD